MNLIKKASFVAMPFAMLLSAGTASAATWDITVTNLTNGNYFTPLLLTASDHDTHLFSTGAAASTALRNMAECGDLTDLVSAANAGTNTVANPVGTSAPGSLLVAGGSISGTVTTTDTNFTHLSVVAMILPTNDAFIGLDSQHIPDFDATAGANNTHTFLINGYDAGTEGNDEILYAGGPPECAPGDGNMMPAPPFLPGTDTGATGVAAAGVGADNNTNVHIHRGILGDAVNDGAGASDLNSSIHRWQNPVAKVVVTVTQ